MAAQLGISTSYLNLIERSQRPVTVPFLLKLGQAFDIDLQRFADDDEGESPPNCGRCSATRYLPEAR